MKISKIILFFLILVIYCGVQVGLRGDGGQQIQLYEDEDEGSKEERRDENDEAELTAAYINGGLSLDASKKEISEFFEGLRLKQIGRDKKEKKRLQEEQEGLCELNLQEVLNRSRQTQTDKMNDEDFGAEPSSEEEFSEQEGTSKIKNLEKYVLSLGPLVYLKSKLLLNLLSKIISKKEDGMLDIIESFFQSCSSKLNNKTSLYILSGLVVVVGVSGGICWYLSFNSLRSNSSKLACKSD